jgi:hypothetical protein
MYPADITSEENSKLKYPFLDKEEYESVFHLDGNSVILVKKSKCRLTESDIAAMVDINRKIAACKTKKPRK